MGKEKLSQAGAEFSPEEKSIRQSRCLVGRRRDAPGDSLPWKCKKREWWGVRWQWPCVCIWTDGLDLLKKFLRTLGFPFKSWATLGRPGWFSYLERQLPFPKTTVGIISEGQWLVAQTLGELPLDRVPVSFQVGSWSLLCPEHTGVSPSHPVLAPLGDSWVLFDSTS